MKTILLSLWKVALFTISISFQILFFLTVGGLLSALIYAAVPILPVIAGFYLAHRWLYR